MAKGKQIKTLDALMNAARDRKAVIVPGTCFKKPTPAAFIINQQGAVIYRLLGYGMYIYKAKEKPMYKTVDPKVFKYSNRKGERFLKVNKS